MSTPLSLRLSDDVKAAMRAKESMKLTTLRFLQAAIKTQEIANQKPLNDSEIQSIIERQIKQRRESISAFEQAGRTESAEKEQAEIDILQDYLPEQAKPEEVTQIIDAAIAEVSGGENVSPALMGKVMGVVRAQLAGRADMGAVSAQIKAKLSA